MGLYDRDYSRPDYRPRYTGHPRLRDFFPKPENITKKLILINIAVFLITALISPLGDFCFKWFSVFPRTIGTSLQLWRVITYQFLHANLGHIFWNMFGLYIFGTLLERYWKGKKFLTFYLVCGAMGGILYPLFVNFEVLRPLPMVGASGAIYGLIAAAAIMFPMLRMYIWGLLPVRLYAIAIIYLAVSIFGYTSGNNRGGEMAHLAGMAAGAIYVLWTPLTSKISAKTLAKRRNKFINDQLVLQRQVDRILRKVSEKGIHSLTLSEKRLLKKASRSQHQNHP